jgi:hypothetical protein
MSRDIRTRPVSRTPREMDKSARIPKELIRRGLSDVKEKLPGQEREPVAQDGARQNYAVRRYCMGWIPPRAKWAKRLRAQTE